MAIAVVHTPHPELSSLKLQQEDLHIPTRKISALCLRCAMPSIVPRRLA